MLIFKKFTFDSAHSLPNVPDGHKCKEVHGHTYKLTVFLEGDLDPKLGWVMDFAELKSVVKPVVDEIDHKYMNEIPGLENPTCEVIAKWIWDRINPVSHCLPRFNWMKPQRPARFILVDDLYL